MAQTQQTRVILFFIDGLGIGKRDANNPLAATQDSEPLANFQDERNQVYLDGVMVPTDPRLGVNGRPQSASGQTAILTGINAPKLLGYHKQGFPNQELKDLIAAYSIFLQLTQRKIGPNVFANAYTPRFFKETPRWKSATTCALEAAGVPFRKLPDLAGRKALYHDFTNRVLREQGFRVPELLPAEAAEILSDISRCHRFTLYEHFMTDKIGHDQDFEKAREHLPKLAEFVRETLGRIDLEKTTFILTSDHGNIEDLSVRNHTLNDVPTILWGRGKEAVAGRIKDLSDITPLILELLA